MRNGVQPCRVAVGHARHVAPGAEVQRFVQERHDAPAPRGLGVKHDGQVQQAAVEHVGKVARQRLDQMQADVGIALVHGL
ncbi:hypothetical protein G6F68_011834 [Rhizopus microsporus]|nr:hypothetical protein G6F68_011834 [Rhizopus microsporus]